MDGFRESQSDTLTLYPFGPLHDSKSFLLQICPQTSMRSVPLFCTANGRERERDESLLRGFGHMRALSSSGGGRAGRRQRKSTRLLESLRLKRRFRVPPTVSKTLSC